jgi:hypothetical protein
MVRHLHRPDVGQLAESTVVVHAVADRPDVGDVEADVGGVDLDLAPRGLADRGTERE